MPVGSISASRRRNAISAYPSTLALLLRMEGVDTGTTFTDSSPNPKTITNVAGVTTSTARFKEGASSALYGGSGSGGLSSPDHADFDFGSSPLTISAWVYKTNSSWGNIIGQRDGDPAWSLGHNSSGQPEWLCSTTGTTVSLVGGRQILNEWVHYAISRNASGVWRLRQNGKIVATTTNTSAVAAVTHVLRLFRTASGGTNLPLSGNIDLAMIVNGVDLFDTSDPVLMPTAINATPNFFVAPKISDAGGRAAGNTLTCSSGLAWPNAGTYSYQWKAAGTPISGATSSSYTIQAGDVVGTLSCEVSNGPTSYEVAVGYHYWRVVMTGASGNTFGGFGEIEFRDAANNVLPTGSITATASSQFDANWPPSEAFNDVRHDNDDGWLASNGAVVNQYITAYCANTISVKKIAIAPVYNFTTSLPSSFKLQYSEDGSTYFDANSFSTGSGVAGVFQVFSV